MLLRHVLATAAFVGAAALLLLTGLGWSAQQHELRRGSVFARLAALDRAHRADPWPARAAAPGGGTAPGHAFDHYAAAARLLTARRLRWDDQARALRENGQPVAPARLAELRAAWAPALLELRVGTRCATVPLPRVRHTVDERLLPMLLTETAAALAEGPTTAALPLWRDALTFAIDRLQPCGWRDAGIRSVLALLDDGTLRAAPTVDLRALHTALADLDAVLAVAPGYERSLAARALARVSDPPTGWHWSAWSHGFDLEAREFAAIAELLDLAAPLTPPAEPGAARSAQWQAWRATPRRHASPWSRFVEPSLEAEERQLFACLRRLRQIRLAVAFHAGMALPGLADPLAGEPLVAEVDAAGRNASLGAAPDAAPWQAQRRD